MTGLPLAPTRFEAVPAWAASFGSELQPYLLFLGTALVRTAGTPEQLDSAVTRWQESSRLLAESLQALTHPPGDAAAGWHGPAAEGFWAEYRPLQDSATAQQARIAKAAAAVSRMAAALRSAHQRVEQVTTAFVADALHAQQSP